MSRAASPGTGLVYGVARVWAIWGRLELTRIEPRRRGAGVPCLFLGECLAVLSGKFAGSGISTLTRTHNRPIRKGFPSFA